MTRIFTSLSDPDLVDMITNGSVGIIPTDTVYGLVARAELPKAVAKLYATKPRILPPGTMISADIDGLKNIGFPEDGIAIAARYWPAAVSVVLDGTNVAHYIKQRRDAIPARIPNQPELLHLLEATGPLMTTSANIPDQPTSTNLSMAMSYFGDTVDFYVEGGDLSDRPPSTIIGLRPDGTIVVYRQGAVHIPS